MNNYDHLSPTACLSEVSGNLKFLQKEMDLHWQQRQGKGDEPTMRWRPSPMATDVARSAALLLLKIAGQPPKCGECHLPLYTPDRCRFCGWKVGS